MLLGCSKLMQGDNRRNLPELQTEQCAHYSFPRCKILVLCECRRHLLDPTNALFLVMDQRLLQISIYCAWHRVQAQNEPLINYQGSDVDLSRSKTPSDGGTAGSAALLWNFLAGVKGTCTAVPCAQS